MYTENNINIVFLMMGDACNFSCRHCVQSEYSLAQRPVSAKVYSYLEHLANIRPDEDDKIVLRFWGGEPLVYFDKIKEVVAKLSTKFEYAVISNGGLLDKEMVEFFNEYNIAFVLSNDGMHTDKIRDKNMLEDENFLQLFRQIKLKSINAVVHAYSQDYYAFWQYIDSKEVDCSASFEDLICNWNMPVDIFAYNLERYREHMRLIVNNAYANLINKAKRNREYKLIALTVHRMLNVMANYSASEIEVIDAPACRQILSVMNVDLDGNVYPCHNQGAAIGTVDDDYSELVNRYLALFNAQYENSECIECEFLDVCRGGCPFSEASAGKSACCERKKIYFLACMDFIGLLKLEDVELEV